MMRSFARVEAFVHTAEKRSFRAAAGVLGVTPAAVSKAVAALEAELGVRLLARSSRHVAPTAEGELYLRHAREALDRLQAGQDLVTRAAGVVQGPARVSMSLVFGRPVVAALPRLLARYPALQVELRFSDVAVNLVEEEVDLVLRTGTAPDSGLVGRRLRTPRWVTVASPDYLARAGEPREPGELARHRCLHFVRPNGQVAGWRFAGDAGLEAPFVAPGALRLDHGELLVDAAVAGLGLARVFDFMVREELHRKALVEVLPRLSLAGPPVHALCLPGRQKVPKIRALLDFAVEVVGAFEGEGA